MADETENKEAITEDKTLSGLRQRLNEKYDDKCKDKMKDKDGDNDGNSDDDNTPKPFKKDKDMKEETMAAASLHPAARDVFDKKALAPSKVEMMKHMVNVMAGMKKGDMTDWFKQAMEVYGPNKDLGVPG